MSTELDSNRQALEARANFLRTRLGDTIDAIARRGKALASPRTQLARYSRPLIMIGAAFGVVLLGGAIASVVAARRLSNRLPRERVKALARIWKHPDRIAAQRRPPMLFEIGRNILVGAASFIAMQLVKRAGSRALPARIE